MTGNVGRPKKGTEKQDSKKAIVQAAVDIIKESDAASVTVRNVCAKANVSTGTFYHHFHDKDDLMMYFVADSIFSEQQLKTPVDDLAGRIVELYSALIEQYMQLGKDFMKSFYTTDNTALSAYLGQKDGLFMPGSIMARSEQELVIARADGKLPHIKDAHQAAADICTIVKGCVFEWCLSGGSIDLNATLDRIIREYLK